MKKRINIHEPSFLGREKKYLIDCLNTGWVSTSGKYLNLLKRKIIKITKSKFALPVLNATIGLHVSLLTAGVKKDDDVIVPTISFIAPVNAIKYLGANPIFMDVDEKLNFDQEKCIDFISRHTYQKNNFCYNRLTRKKIACLIIVHTFGNAVNFEKLYLLCKKKNIIIVEDAAESLGTKYVKGKFKKAHTGVIGDFGVISFNGNKIVTAGNGGIILIQKKKYYKKAKYLINQAKDDKINFIHDQIGYNYGMSNLSASLGLAQLERLNFFLTKKFFIHQYYKKKFKNISGCEIVDGPSFAKNNYWLNLLKVDKHTKKKFNIKQKYNSKKIQIRPIWYPNHLQKKFKKNLRYKIEKSQKIYSNFICLPSSASLNNIQLDKICNFITKK